MANSTTNTLAQTTTTPTTTLATAATDTMSQTAMQLQAHDDDAMSPQVVDAIRRIFLAFDRDGNGTIERSELGNLVEALGDPMTRAELNDAFHQLDTDASGTIGWDEFIAFWGLGAS